ncbi:hypothetical protein Sste5346_001260 [Sporothrix stenoceras]|uniref:Uncharacterized protein n=1 Tax=Sporothrix stenoceras TaxID=5173 RepID=A0ABR3ZS19_9PEZI
MPFPNDDTYSGILASDNRDETKVLVVLAKSTGHPTLPGSSNESHLTSSNPRGIAIRFDLGNGEHTDIIAQSSVLFPGKTNSKVEAFYKAAGEGQDAFNNYLASNAALRHGQIRTGRYGIINADCFGSAGSEAELEKDLKYQLESGMKIAYDIKLFVAGPSGTVDDVTSLWSGSGPTLSLGTLTLDAVSKETHPTYNAEPNVAGILAVGDLVDL